MTINHWHLFVIGHFTQTPVKYTFSEGLRIVDNQGIFIEKKLRFSEIYSVLFLKVKRFTSEVHFQSDWGGKTPSTSRYPLDNFL